MGRLLGLTLIIAALFDVRPGYACSCLPVGPACSAYWKADAMFTGTVVDIRRAAAGSPEALAVRFAVDQPGRGTDGDSIVIYSTPQDGANCGITFRIGERYVVRAYSESGVLVTTMCSGTKTAAEASADIEFLRAVASRPRGGRSFGQVRLVENSLLTESFDRGPVSGARVRLSNGRVTREAVTAADGVYDFDDLPIGDYQLTFTPPRGVGLPGPPLPPDERVPPGPYAVSVLNPWECVERDFRVRTDAQLRGRLLRSDGSPAANQQVDLVSVAHAQQAYYVPVVSATTDTDGRYTFAFIPPGQYVIGINLSIPPPRTDVDRRAYYPGVRSVVDAPAVTVGGPGARIELQLFRLPPETAR